jgi:serine phosphatase RsbU (regulator of sigma subunit)
LESTVDERTAEVLKQKDELAEKNREITDSINYATRIQNSVLPPLESIVRAFPQSFVLFQPKDIVSGDFYWLHEKADGHLIAVADCTGHGVPGAIMSVIGSEKLTEAANQSADSKLVLQRANKGLKRTLRQSNTDGSTRDGMDIALCYIDKGLKWLDYSGANRPLWLIRKSSNELTEIKPTKSALGGLTDDAQEFINQRIELSEGDTIYMSSDGFADQFGMSDKKMMTKIFKEFLLSIQIKTMHEQQDALRTYFNTWKGTREQTDDVLVIGIRVGV